MTDSCEELPRFMLPAELGELRAIVRMTNQLLPDRLTRYYCGNPATCEDHVIPHSLLSRVDTRRTGYGTDTLPSCTECNSLLGSKVFDSLPDRKAYLAKQLRTRYRKELRAPTWTDSELADLGYNLREHAIAVHAGQARIRARLYTLEDVGERPIPSEPIDFGPCAPMLRPKPKLKPKEPKEPKEPKRKIVAYSKGCAVWTQAEDGSWDYAYENES